MVKLIFSFPKKVRIFLYRYILKKHRFIQFLKVFGNRSNIMIDLVTLNT